MSTAGGNSAMTTIKIKQEPNGICMEKMSSFKAPRDLTLGGAGPSRQRGGAPSKKVYAPNLNVTRNKNSNVKTSKDTSIRGRGRGERGKFERGRGGRGGASSFIQTSGLFSEGAAAVKQLKRSFSGSFRSGGSDSGDSAVSLRRPTISKRDVKTDSKADLERVKDILGESDEDDFDNMKTDVENVPIKLSAAKWNISNVKIEKKESFEAVVKQEIKEEIVDGESDKMAEKLSQMKVKNAQEPVTNVYPTSVEELFKRTQPQMFLIQLPDSLPCQDPDGLKQDVPSSSKDSLEQTTNVNNFGSIKNLEEGQIGKILRYKSGKYKLVLGETRFDLSLGMEAGFAQEVVSINTNREERNGNVINLGSIQGKLTATPDWEFLF